MVFRDLYQARELPKIKYYNFFKKIIKNMVLRDKFLK